MASLKEIKLRITSIQSTQKITSAMKMVSSAKLHHAQAVAEKMLIYEQRLHAILRETLSAVEELTTPYAEQREVKQIALVAFSSNTGLCGSFNANLWKEVSTHIRKQEESGYTVRLYPVGRKVAESIQKTGYPIENQFIHMGDNPTYEEAVNLADTLMDLFASGRIDRVELIYHHFKNRAQQVIINKTFLPVTELNENSAYAVADYIIEPSSEQLLNLLLPEMLHLSIYATLLDTLTAEHAARMLAMQTANDNANDLITQLTLQYNKTRQQAITNELLDIMGGT